MKKKKGNTRAPVARERGIDFDRLTPKQRRFVEHYLAMEDPSPSVAAKKAGYKHTHRGSELLNNPLVKAALGKHEKLRHEAMRVNGDDALREVMCIGMSDIGAYVADDGLSFKPVSEWSEEARRAVSEIEYFTNPLTGEVGIRKIKLWPKQPALELLLKRLDMIPDAEKEYVLTLGSLRKLAEQKLAENVIDVEVIEAPLQME